MTLEFQTVESISQLDPIVFEPIADLCVEMNKEIAFLQSRPTAIIQEIYIRGTIKGLNQAKENMLRYENSKSWKTIWGIFLEDRNGNSIKLELPIEMLEHLDEHANVILKGRPSINQIKSTQPYFYPIFKVSKIHIDGLSAESSDNALTIFQFISELRPKLPYSRLFPFFSSNLLIEVISPINGVTDLDFKNQLIFEEYPAAKFINNKINITSARMLTDAINISTADVIAIVRGGTGDDNNTMTAFNDSEVLKAINANPAFIITGIGHEPDFQLLDLISNHCAITPTAAGSVLNTYLLLWKTIQDSKIPTNRMSPPSSSFEGEDRQRHPSQYVSYLWFVLIGIALIALAISLAVIKGYL